MMLDKARALADPRLVQPERVGEDARAARERRPCCARVTPPCRRGRCRSRNHALRQKVARESRGHREHVDVGRREAADLRQACIAWRGMPAQCLMRAVALFLDGGDEPPVADERRRTSPGTR